MGVSSAEQTTDCRGQRVSSKMSESSDLDSDEELNMASKKRYTA